MSPARDLLKRLIPGRYHAKLRKILASVLLRNVFLYKMRPWTVFTDTGFHFTMPVSPKDAERLEDIYGIKFPIFDANLNKPAHAYSSKVKYPAVVDTIPAGSRVLDLGCGSGVAMGDLARIKNCHVVGLDVNPDSVEIVRSLGLEAYVCDLSNPFDERLIWASKQHWDYVISLGGAFHNFAYPMKLMQIFRKATQIHQIHNAGVWFNRLRLLFGSFPYSPTTEYRSDLYRYYAELNVFRTYWTFADFKRCCEALGFRVESIATVGQPFFGSPLFMLHGFFSLTLTGDLREEVVRDSLDSGLKPEGFQPINSW